MRGDGDGTVIRGPVDGSRVAALPCGDPGTISPAQAAGCAADGAWCTLAAFAGGAGGWVDPSAT